MPVQVFPSVGVIIGAIAAIGGGTYLVDKYIDPRVRNHFLSLLDEALPVERSRRIPYFLVTRSKRFRFRNYTTHI